MLLRAACFIAACHLGSAVAFAQDATALYRQAVTAYEAKDYAKSIELGLASLEKGAKTGTVPYHLACCYALSNKPDDAFKYLNLAIERGWRNLEHMQADADLKSLYADKRWAEAVKACEAGREKHFKSLGNPELAKELLRRMAEDQKARTANPIDAHALEKIDTENTQWLDAAVAKHGWPGKSMVGTDGAQAAWLLVQHADRDPKFQRRCLDLVQEAFKKGETTGQQVAYLTDRVLVNEGKKQLYGTQFFGSGAELRPRPIEDEANVDARRKEMGLEPLAEYAKTMKNLEKR